MKNFFKLVGIIALVSIIGFGMIGCDNGDDGSPTDGGNGTELPKASGTNAVSGKAYFEWQEKTLFSVTADGAESGTYVVTTVDNGTYALGVKYAYNTQIETGTYSWNEGTKTVTLKPEKIVFSSGGPASSPSFDGTVTVENEYGPLKDRAGFRSEVQAMIDAYIKDVSQAEVNQQLSSMGFSSVAAYINYMVDEAFANKTKAYSFTTDNTVLFLEETLPANKGNNEFTGQTYYGLTWNNNGTEKDTYQVYVFTASGYTFTDSRDGSTPQVTIGSYAYDSNQKRVWLRPSTINGKDRLTMYAEQTASSNHHYPDDNTYRAVQTSNRFQFWSEEYNSTNKTIGWEE